mmetsp:Transcript_9611/g.32588  ORF Transcript_9611/g.32588 Transcript_9611/m.32588 type:complete len:154 (+) Transcript_9611:43-504(+)
MSLGGSFGEGVPVASIGSLVSGLFFGIGWDIWIDGCAWSAYHDGEDVNGAYWVPGLLQTLALIMVNVLNWGMLSEDGGFGDESSVALAKCWVFVAFVVAFSGIIGAVWILINESNDPETESLWPAVAGLLQNVFIFLASLIFRVARMRSDSAF